MADSTRILARRYRLLLRAYPPAYRERRGDELVATLLDGAEPGQRVPRLAEVNDLLASGIRTRLGLGSIAGFGGGLTIAAPVALAVAAGLSAFLIWRVEPIAKVAMPDPSFTKGQPLFGAFQTTGPIAYLAWLVAAAARALASRPAIGRACVAVAIALTALAVPLLAAATPIDRPPLWVLMALTAFGLLAFSGTGPAAGARSAPSADERIGVAAGAVAIAVSASTVMLAPAPFGGGWGYYYEPTIARVGVVVTGAVAAIALITFFHLVRAKRADDWLWATALLGLPAGWLGPLEVVALRLPFSGAAAPHFGRLAQVLLATCVGLATMRWLAQRREPGAPAVRRVDRNALGVSGAIALGSAAGLAAVLAAGARLSGVAVSAAFPVHVAATLAVLAGIGIVAVTAGRSALPHAVGVTVSGAAVAAVLGAAVAVYRDDWTVRAWTSVPRTAALVATLAYLPLALCAAVAAGLLREHAIRWAAAAVLAAGAGWLCYATMPYLLAWGPVVLVFGLCAVMLAVLNRRVQPPIGVSQPNNH